MSSRAAKKMAARLAKRLEGSSSPEEVLRVINEERWGKVVNDAFQNPLLRHLERSAPTRLQWGDYE